MKRETTRGLHVESELVKVRLSKKTSICSGTLNHFDQTKPCLAFELSSQYEKCTTLVI